MKAQTAFLYLMNPLPILVTVFLLRSVIRLLEQYNQQNLCYILFTFQNLAKRYRSGSQKQIGEKLKLYRKSSSERTIAIFSAYVGSRNLHNVAIPCKF